MERKPIIQPQYEVVVSQEPVKFADMLPRLRYEFQNAEVPKDAEVIYQSLIDFLETNSSIVLEGNCDEGYQRGFQKSLALVRLWIDSLYIEKGASGFRG